MDAKSLQQFNQVPIYKMPLLGERAAPFKADTTKGPINFPFDYAGKWVIFFSHPGDFQPVCTSEIMTFQTMQQEFKDLNAELLGLSVDSIDSHLGWLNSIYNIEWNDLKDVSINYPIVADPSMEISKKYGMVHRGETDSSTVRALFIIDPDARIRTILYYPNEAGRNLEEVKRTLLALQESDRQKVGTPANWVPGENVLLPPPQTTKELVERNAESVTDEEIECVEWYMCFTPDSTSATEGLNIKPNKQNYIKPSFRPPYLKT